MGIEADKYFVMRGKATIGKCYIRVRDINTTKNNDIHTFQYRIDVLADSELVTTEFKFLERSNVPIIENGWKVSYDHLKEELTKQGITFTDVL